MRPTARANACLLAATAAFAFAVASTEGAAHAEERHYRRLTLSVNAPYLLVPVYQLNAELAVKPRWSVALRGGGGRTDSIGGPLRVGELGAQAVHYLTGHANRGLQLGIDARIVGYEGGGQLLGLGTGLGVGPFLGYKRVFAPGFTLVGQVGAQLAVAGESSGPVVPYLAVSLGWSFWSTGRAPATEAATSVSAAARGQAMGPLDHHRGLLVGFSIGGGALVTEACSDCETEPGIAVGASVGWFLGRRLALMADVTSAVALQSGGLESAGFGLLSLAVQVWPHEKLWLKLGVGQARLISASLIDAPANENGGGGTLATGYEVHHDRGFTMDFQLRATHGSFDTQDGAGLGVNTFTGLVGFHWY